MPKVVEVLCQELRLCGIIGCMVWVGCVLFYVVGTFDKYLYDFLWYVREFLSIRVPSMIISPLASFVLTRL
jgi:hypothetical protein